MNLKRTFAVVLTLALIAALLIGCAKTEKPAETQASTEASKPAATEAAPVETEPAETDGVFIVLNGVNVTTGVAYASIADRLGDETRPPETIEACDPASDWRQTMHYYGDNIVTEDKDGIIDTIQIYNDEAALMGQFRIGAAAEDVRALFGTPETEGLLGMYYSERDPMVNVFLENGIVTGFNLMMRSD